MRFVSKFNFCTRARLSTEQWVLRYFEPHFDNFSLSSCSACDSQPEPNPYKQRFVKEAISIHSAHSIVLFRAFTEAVTGMKDERVTGVNFGHCSSERHKYIKADQ
jgi:hypothetical protein